MLPLQAGVQIPEPNGRFSCLRKHGDGSTAFQVGVEVSHKKFGEGYTPDEYEGMLSVTFKEKKTSLIVSVGKRTIGVWHPDS